MTGEKEEIAKIDAKKVMIKQIPDQEFKLVLDQQLKEIKRICQRGQIDSGKFLLKDIPDLDIKAKEDEIIDTIQKKRKVRL